MPQSWLEPITFASDDDSRTLGVGSKRIASSRAQQVESVIAERYNGVKAKLIPRLQPDANPLNMRELVRFSKN